MDKTSISTTAMTSLGTAGGTDVILWLWNGPLHPMPESVAFFFIALLAPLFHASYQALMAWLAPSVEPSQAIPAISPKGETNAPPTPAS